MVPIKLRDVLIVDIGNGYTSSYRLTTMNTCGSTLILTGQRDTFTYDSNFPRFGGFDEPKLAYCDRVLKRVYGRRLTNAEKAHMREWNFKPTAEGVAVAENWHELRTRLRRPASFSNYYFDRRIPCWRSGRWKSLT